MVKLDYQTITERKDPVLGLMLHPLPGECFAIAPPESEAMQKGIYIPDAAMTRNAPGYVAEVVMENAITEPKSQTTIRGTVGRMCAFARWAGQRFHYAGLDLIRYKLSIEHFLAVYFDGNWIPLISEGHEMRVTTAGADDAILRCRYCRSTGQGNIILDGDGKCPQCGRTRSGRVADKFRYTTRAGETVTLDHPLTMTEQERQAYGAPNGKGGKCRTKNITEQPALKSGKILSFAGQKIHSPI